MCLLLRLSRPETCFVLREGLKNRAQPFVENFATSGSCWSRGEDPGRDRQVLEVMKFCREGLENIWSCLISRIADHIINQHCRQHKDFLEFTVLRVGAAVNRGFAYQWHRNRSGVARCSKVEFQELNTCHIASFECLSSCRDTGEAPAKVAKADLYRAPDAQEAPDAEMFRRALILK